MSDDAFARGRGGPGNDVVDSAYDREARIGLRLLEENLLEQRRHILGLGAQATPEMHYARIDGEAVIVRKSDARAVLAHTGHADPQAVMDRWGLKPLPANPLWLVFPLKLFPKLSAATFR